MEVSDLLLDIHKQNCEILQRMVRVEARGERAEADLTSVSATVESLLTRTMSLEEERERREEEAAEAKDARGKWGLARLSWLNTLCSSLLGALAGRFLGHH